MNKLKKKRSSLHQVQADTFHQPADLSINGGKPDYKPVYQLSGDFKECQG